MRTLTDPRPFLSDPVGAQLVTQHFAYWYPHQALTGFALWGCPGPADVQLLNRVMDVVLEPSGGRHISLIDMAFLATVDPIAFRVMAEYLASRWERFGKLIIRQALIRPPSFAGAVVAGFYDVITPNYPVKIFAELEPELEWLGVTNDRALLRAVTASREGAEQVDPVLRQLRIVLRRAPDLNLLDAATKLAVSPRTLQRKLMAKNTTFQNEVHTAKLQGAQTLMLAGGSSLTRIALELGFASLQHFSALFSKHYGHSPSSWLRQRVAGSAGGAAGAQSAQPSARLGHIDSDQQPIRIANDDDSTMGKDRIKPPALGGGGVSGDISIGEGVVL